MLRFLAKTIVVVTACGLALVAAKSHAVSNGKPEVETHASIPLPEKVTLDQQEYEQREILRYFLDAAFTNHPLAHDEFGRPDLRSLQPYPDGYLLSDSYLKNHYPWLHPFVFPDHVPPKLLVINKWAKPFSISFGMPNDLRPYGGDRYAPSFKIFGDMTEKEAKNAESLLPALERHVSEIANLFRALSGLNIEYLPSSQETKETYGRVRINLVSASTFVHEGIVYKLPDNVTRTISTSGGGPSDAYFRGVGNVESRLHTGFAFTAGTERQVDGYILTNGKNEIEFAVCYIWVGHNLPLIRSLVNECLLRAMGLPEEVLTRRYHAIPVSHLTPWNDPDRWLESQKKLANPPLDITEFDRYMVELLYRTELEAGMDFIEAQRVLLGQ